MTTTADTAAQCTVKLLREQILRAVITRRIVFFFFSLYLYEKTDVS